MFTLDKIYRSDKKWFKYLKNIKKAKNFSNDKFLPSQITNISRKK